MPSDLPPRDRARREPRFAVESDEPEGLAEDLPEDDRPDIPPFPPDDRDSVFARPPRRGLARLLPTLIVAVALGGFAATIWWAYRSATTGGGEAEVPLILAEPGPEKTRPESEGGLDVPDQDKLVYEQMAPEAGQPRVERLLPPPEAPLLPVAPTVEPAPPAVIPPPPVVEAPEIEPSPPVAETAAPPAVAEAPPEPLPPAPAAAPPPPPLVAALAGFRVQLAALRSAEAARAEATRLQRVHGDALGALRLAVEEADLGQKGVFFRIQAGPLADRAAAAELCARLKSRAQPCLIVGP